MVSRGLRALAQLVVLGLVLIPASHALAKSEKAQKTVIFDLDDTLIATEQVYVRAAKDFRALAKAHGLDDQKAHDLLQATDLEMFKTLGLSQERYPTSMAQTMLELTGDAKLAEEARAIGQRVFTQRPKKYPHAERVLAEYKRLGFRIILLTKGDKTIQDRRVAQSGLAKYFDDVEVVQGVDMGVYTQLIGRYNLDPKRTFAIGNSYLSDIKTAQAAGIPGRNTVWLSNRLVWKHELIGLSSKAARKTTLRANSLLAAQALTLDRRRSLPGGAPRARR